ncbi:hypothetical protein [Streptomyces sp. NPDC001880]
MPALLRRALRRGRHPHWYRREHRPRNSSFAHRFSRYQKSGILNGERFEGEGRKTTQFIRTPVGWRMSSMAWDDV